MSDVDCPHCGTAQDIDHDDGYGYAEDQRHEQPCVSCGQSFGYFTSVLYLYETETHND